MSKITIDYFDHDGDVCGIEVNSRGKAIEILRSMNHLRIIGWHFSSEAGTENDFEIYDVKELVVN